MRTKNLDEIFYLNFRRYLDPVKHGRPKFGGSYTPELGAMPLYKPMYDPEDTNSETIGYGMGTSNTVDKVF